MYGYYAHVCRHLPSLQCTYGTQLSIVFEQSFVLIVAISLELVVA
jgi:hypothetical protein